ncbi:MAG: deaminase [Candidatus Parcubacteria bacterium]|nr:deaminase [Candidatus Parcubacteria bacterium]
MKKYTVVAFVPVLHCGYVEFFKKYPGSLYLLYKDTFPELSFLERDLRALPSELMISAIESLGIFRKIKELSKENLLRIQKSRRLIVMPKEDICLDVAKKYFPHNRVLFDNVFLRWDKMAVINAKKVVPEFVSRDLFDKEIMKLAYNEAEKSSDWWRHVGTVVVKDRKILLCTHNTHFPSPHSPYVNGDPRFNFGAGEMTHISSALHSERMAVGMACREGISFEGADMYVTTFPCSDCAFLAYTAGIKRIFYAEGCSSLDTEKTLREKKVPLIFVEM